MKQNLRERIRCITPSFASPETNTVGRNVIEILKDASVTMVYLQHATSSVLASATDNTRQSDNTDEVGHYQGTLSAPI